MQHNISENLIGYTSLRSIHGINSTSLKKLPSWWTRPESDIALMIIGTIKGIPC
jgi:hypothetical protein